MSNKQGMSGAALAHMLGVLAVLFVFLSAKSAAEEPIAEIPYQYGYSGWLTVPVTVNGEGPYDFIIDSGATLSVVFQNLADQQEFPYVDAEPKRILGLIEANDLPPRRIGRLETGGQAIDDVVSVVIADWGPPGETPQGVLGLDFLSRYALHIDPGAQTIKLYSKTPEEIATERGWSRTRLRPTLFKTGARPLYIVNARIRSRLYPFILDLGASGTVMNSAAAQDIMSPRRVPSRGAGAPRIKPTVQDLFGAERTSQLVLIKRLKIGKAIFRDRIVNVYDSEVFNELGVADEPYGLLGLDLLEGRQVVVDFPGNRFYIGPETRRRENN